MEIWDDGSAVVFNLYATFSEYSLLTDTISVYERQ